MIRPPSATAIGLQTPPEVVGLEADDEDAGAKHSPMGGLRPVVTLPSLDDINGPKACGGWRFATGFSAAEGSSSRSHLPRRRS
jgi:hypothetical protein